METAPLKSFATWARRELITQVSARLTAVLAPASPERVENQRAVTMLERDITAAGDGAKGKDMVADKVAYTWFNRIIALRFMDANGYTPVGIVSPSHGQHTGQPEILADAKRGSIDPAVVTNKRTLNTITSLLDGTRPSSDAQGEAYTLLLAEYCRHWNRSMPFMFEREGDYTELLIPSNLLSPDSILARATAVLTEDACRDVEVIGWLYQFYISERKQEVFDGFKAKGPARILAGAAEIPAATQLFTPHWIVRYLVENSLGRLWMLNHPSSRLVDQMAYYIAPVEEETDYLEINSPEELTVIDPACGSGHMLTYAFDLVYAIYEEEGYAPSEIPGLILTHNLFATEIDPRAGALASFALTMKARAKQRTFFNKQVEPNICVIEPISFNQIELDGLWSITGGSGLTRADADTFWNTFEHADVLGSLIQPNTSLTGLLGSLIEDIYSDNLIADEALGKATRVVEQAVYLTRKYTVAVANPPYMSIKNMDVRLADYAKNSFPSSKSDLFAMFIERCLGITTRRGATAMITMQSWMFISSYEALRQQIVHSSPASSMLHLGERAFDSIGGAVVSTTAFVLEPSGDASRPASYVRAVDGENEAAKRATVLEAAKDADCEWRFSASSEDFAKLPGSPIVYWLSSKMLSVLSLPKRMKDVSPAKLGMRTGDNQKWLRLWFEVSRIRSYYSAQNAEEAQETDSAWFPYNKGGEYRRWYGNRDYVVFWPENGYAIKEETLQKYPQLSWDNLGWKITNESDFFKPSLTWTFVGSSTFGVRWTPQGALFDVGGSSTFPEPLELKAVLSYLCSSVAGQLMAATNPTINFQVANVNALPWLDMGSRSLRTDEVISRLIEVSRADWDDLETSWDFAVPSWLRQAASVDIRLEDHFSEASHGWAQTAREQQSREAENNRIVAEAFGLERDVPIEVPLHRVSLTRSVEFRYGPSKTPAEYAALEQADLAAELISYAVGCMFGRYSLDESGLILADQGATVQDYLVKVPRPTFAPDADNVLPIVDGDWFEDDIVARIRQFLRAAFGEQYFEENLRFVEESLGVKSLREYFITRAGRSKFYDDHVRRYKKRPIYWLFSSPNGSFNALIYMHRYTPSTVSTVLNEYLREFEAKLEASRQHQERLAAGDGTAREKAGALKEADRLRKVLLELSEYEHDVLYPLASQQIAIDLDDGVKANYPKFYPALKKIAGLESADE